jgi:ribosomal protein S18 acetylase RimI-like enzyme
MIVRAYRESDEAAVVALWGANLTSRPWNEPVAAIHRKLEIQREMFLVAEVDGQVVGTTMAGYDGHRGWIYSVAVHSDHRRKGIATAMIREAERLLKAIDCPKINLQVMPNNPAAVALYDSLGYAIEDRVSMGKPII